MENHRNVNRMLSCNVDRITREVKKVQMKDKTRVLDDIAQAIASLDIKEVRTMTEDAIKSGIPPYTIVTNGMARGMDIVGRRYDAKEYFLPELIMAGEAMKAGLEILDPYLRKQKAANIGIIVIGTVKGDIHDIGKNIVSTMLIGNGFKVHDVGVDVPPEEFISEVREVDANILAVSALLLTTMPEMKLVIDELDKAKLRGRVKVMVGGRPVTSEFASEIGADAYGKDAVEAVRRAKELCGH